MNLVSWNCNMAFRKKWKCLSNIPADLMIISECEQEQKFENARIIKTAHQFMWFGENVHKGISIISFNGYALRICPFYSAEYKYIIPLEVKKGTEEYLLFAIWAMPHKANNALSYVGQIWAALTYYAPYIHEKTILTGDFNSNAIWDRTRKTGNHSQLETFLAERGIISLYHHQTNEISGQESMPSFFLHKKREKPYHLDYCFASKELINSKTNMVIGEYDDWIKQSDHMPVMVYHLG